MKTTRTLYFDDNKLLQLLFGAQDQNLKHIEKALKVTLGSRGNEIAIEGILEKVIIAEVVLNFLYERLKKGLDVGVAEADAAIRMVESPKDKKDMTSQNKKPKIESSTFISTYKKTITPRSFMQANYIQALRSHDLTFGIGPAGTGKTYLAVAVAVSLMMEGKVDKIILSRPAVEAGERLGFLPGDLKEKVDPYLRPLYDALEDTMPLDILAGKLAASEIEIAPLAFMRGRTLSNAFVILDEAQNTTPMQMKMFLTRLGENSRMAVTGDITQVDLPNGVNSGLREAMHILKGVPEISFIHFTESDVVRHPLVGKIVHAYENS